MRRYEKANKPLSSYEMDIRDFMNKEVWAAFAAVRLHAEPDLLAAAE